MFFKEKIIFENQNHQLQSQEKGLTMTKKKN